jgi:hypothetical protein
MGRIPCIILVAGFAGHKTRNDDNINTKNTGYCTNSCKRVRKTGIGLIFLFFYHFWLFFFFHRIYNNGLHQFARYRFVFVS